MSVLQDTLDRYILYMGISNEKTQKKGEKKKL